MSDETGRESRKQKRDLDRVNTRTQEARREDAEKVWREDPIGQFESEKHGDITDADLKKRLKVIKRFDKYLRETVNETTTHDILDPRDAVEKDVERFINDVLKPDPTLGNRTIADRLSHLAEFYTVLNRENAYAGTPVREPLKTFKKNHDLESDRPYLPFNRLQTFLNWLDQPFSRAMWLLAFKLGLRKGEMLNMDLRCLNIDYPVFDRVIDNHNVQLDPRIRDKPDTVLIYGKFNEGAEIPNEEIPGPETSGEIRNAGNKRKQEDGSVLPVDSELKTALIEWLLVRPSTEHKHTSCHPLFATGTKNPSRITSNGTGARLWRRDSYIDSIQRFAAEETLEECPTCGDDGRLVESNLTSTKKPGRRFRCRNCEQRHWRSIYWSNDPNEDETEQRMTYHQGRHTFSSAHNPENTGLHDGAIPDKIRKKQIRGDSNEQGADTEDTVYVEEKYQDFEADVRKPYLDGIYKFNIYDNPILAVGEGWNE